MIDDRALVDSSAQIGNDVTIGPFTIIESGVAIGSGTWIGPNVVIRRNTTIGVENKIYQFSSVGEDPQYASYRNEDTYLEIGDRNVVRAVVWRIGLDATRAEHGGRGGRIRGGPGNR